MRSWYPTLFAMEPRKGWGNHFFVGDWGDEREIESGGFQKMHYGFQKMHYS